MEQAERELAVRQVNFARLEQLYEAGAITEADYEEARNMLAQAQTRLELERQALALLRESAGPGSGTQQFYEGKMEALQAQISYLEYQKSRSRITAPLSGIVSDLGIKEGEPANPAVPLMKIFDPSRYAVETYVLTGDIRGIKEGMEVDVILDGRGEDVAYRGLVKSIAPSAVSMISALGLEEQRVKVTVELKDAAAAGLFPGYTVDVAFTVDERKDVLVVPRTALFPYEGGDALWVVVQGRAEIRPVQTGFHNSRDVVITEGLTAGDLVILNPQLEGLRSGKKIKVLQ
ncbi:MAG TPA: efflux RND transporter periplasmic adaptor subunit [Clostridia bacterium]|nr:efflux RND transporter periplasmic adaptor subunit [Clostridia bacterium]